MSADLNHWTALWQSGVLHSCNSAIAGNYDGQIKTFWERQFNNLIDGQQVADLGTGNGALPLLAKATNPALILHGIDSALINPVQDMRNSHHDYGGIQFHPGCPMNALPFPDGSIQLVTSQFAFEYAPLSSSLAEVLRVLDPQCGRVAMVLHSVDSVVCHMTQCQLQALQLLFEDLNIFHKASVLAAALQHRKQGIAGNPEQARDEFNIAASKLTNELSLPAAAPILEKAYALLHGALMHLASAPEYSADLLEKAGLQLRREQQRLQEMQLATYDQQRLQMLANTLQQAGFKVTTGTLQHAESTMGWTMVAHRE